MVRDRDGRPQEDPLAVHCFCLCSGSVLLGDLLGVSRSSERDLLSVLSNYPRIFFCVFIVYRRIVKYSLSVVFCYMLMSVDCFGLVVSTCQVIGYRKTLWWHLHEVRRLSPQSSGGRVCLCAFFFYLVCLCSYVFPRPYAIYIYFIPLRHDIAYMCWKCRWTRSKLNKQTRSCYITGLGRVTVRVSWGQVVPHVTVTFCGIMVTRLRVWFWIWVDWIKEDCWTLAEVSALYWVPF